MWRRNMSQIYFNGKTYNDLAEMPAAERQMYDQLMSALVDKDGNGMPDIFEGDVVGNLIAMARKSGYGDSEQIEALEKISPEMRARISKGIAKLQEFGLLSGVQDLAEEATHASPAKTIPTWEDAEIRPSRPAVQTPSVIQEDRGPSWLLVVGILAAIAIFLAGLAFIIVSRGGL
jgi:hypothetical protein